MSLPVMCRRQLSLQTPITDRPVSPEPSCVSLKSNQSKDIPLMFKDGFCPEQSFISINRPEKSQQRPESPGPAPSCLSSKTNCSKSTPLLFKDGPSPSDLLRLDQDAPNGQPVQQHQSHLGPIFTRLEEIIAAFVKSELKKMKNILSPDYPDCSEGCSEEEKASDDAEERRRSNSSREAILTIVLNYLRGMKQKELADCLQRRSPGMCQLNLKSNLKDKFQCVFEGVAKAGRPTLLNQIYTELYITEGGTGEVNCEHEVVQIETASKKAVKTERKIRLEDIFKASLEREEPSRTVLTKGVAGIGKTILTQKFTLDWAEDKANRDIHFIFPFTFRELNVLKKKKLSLVQLVHHFFNETKQAGISRFERFQVAFIFDGLDECRLPLDFVNAVTLTDVGEPVTVDVLLTNLIRGNLLPSARLWITTRPAAANQIPPECVDVATEVRGFTDQQKEEYFRKRFRDEKLANKIVSHVGTSRSLHIMCHIPVFCWITATVLEEVLRSGEGGELPKTLTEMYVHFLAVQSKLKYIKYDGGTETESHWIPQTRNIIEKLGKLAFEQLQEGNLTFYESDLTECGIEVRAASLYSGVFTQIFKEEKGLYCEKLFCFVHLSVQEFLAALYVHLTFINSGVNLLSEQTTSQASDMRGDESAVTCLYQRAVDGALQSPNGHLDLFLRFLLGLALQTNRTLLRGLMRAGSGSWSNGETVQYIKRKIEENPSPERSINLFHCLNELKDHSLVEEIQQYLRSGSLVAGKLSPAQWSALVFILLSSERDMDVFDLKKYSASEEGLLRLLPVIRVSKKALLSGCNLTERSCEALASVLSSRSCSLKELDLSNNDLRDSGAKLLCAGLRSQQCSLQVLRLSGCLITETGCSSLASALSSNPSPLRELDLSYNHPGPSAAKHLWADPCGRPDALRLDPSGARWLTPGLRKYFRNLTLNPNTAHKFLQLSENNKKVTDLRKDHLYPHCPERFDYWPQVLCEDSLTGRCYWEVEWVGKVYVAVSYEGIGRNGDSDSSKFGGNDRSWCLACTDGGYNAWHDNSGTLIPCPSDSSVPNRVAVFVDCPAGILSFYRVSSEALVHLHTFRASFTDRLYAGFGYGVKFNASASLCQPETCP